MFTIGKLKRAIKNSKTKAIFRIFPILSQRKESGRILILTRLILSRAILEDYIQVSKREHKFEQSIDVRLFRRKLN